MSYIVADAENPGRVQYVGTPLGESFTGIEDGAIDTAQLATDAVSGLKLKIGSQSWSHNLVFSSSDADTVAWASGTITMADGTTTFSISSGDTGDMTSRTYIYLDTGVSTTVLQKTDTAGTAVGDGKVLIAVAEDETSEATFQVFGGRGGLAISANEITANEVITNSAQIASAIISDAHITGTITVGKTDAKCTDALADQTSANTAADTAKTQGVTLMTGGYVKTDYLTATNIQTGTLTLASGGVNLVVSSGELTLNSGADIILQAASVSDVAELKFVDADYPTTRGVKMSAYPLSAAFTHLYFQAITDATSDLAFGLVSHRFREITFLASGNVTIGGGGVRVGGAAAMTLRPQNTGVSHCGDSTYYWFEVHSKHFTDRTCLFDSKDGIELQDGKMVSNVEALKQMEKHPTKKVPQGLPAFNYRTLPKAAYRPATIPGKDNREGILCPRDRDDLPYVWEDNETKKHTAKKGKKPATKKISADGAEMTAMISVLMGAVKELDGRLVKIEV